MQADILFFLDQGLILTQACSKLHLMQKVFSSEMFLSVVILACPVVQVRILGKNVILGLFGCLVVLCLDANTMARCLRKPHLAHCTLLTGFLWPVAVNGGMKMAKDYVPTSYTRASDYVKKQETELVLHTHYWKRL